MKKIFLIFVVFLLTAVPLLVSAVFQFNDGVQTKANLNVRQFPSISGKFLGTQPTGQSGSIIAGPINADGYNWWQVDYNSGPDGWSIQNYLTQSIESGLSTTPQPDLSQQTQVARKFQPGDRILVTGNNLRVRLSPSIDGVIIDSQNSGWLGTVVFGPFRADGFTWWYINYDIESDGWSIENYLEKVGGSPSPTPTPTPTPSLTPTPITVDLKANGLNGPITINYNTSANLSWTSSGANNCVLRVNDLNTGWQGTSQSDIPTGNITIPVSVYKVACIDGSGSNTATDSVTIYVRQSPSPKKIHLAPTIIPTPMILTPAPSQTGTVCVEVIGRNPATNDAYFVDGPGSDDWGWNGSKCFFGHPVGFYSVSAPGGTVLPSNANLTNSGTITFRATFVSVSTPTPTPTSTLSPTPTPTPTPIPTQPPNPPLVSVSISANPNPVDYNSQSYLSWSSTNAEHCVLYVNNNVDTGWRGLSQSNIPTGNLTRSNTYRIDCINSIGGYGSDLVIINLVNIPAGKGTVCVTSDSSNAYFVNGPDQTWGWNGPGTKCFSDHVTGTYYVNTSGVCTTVYGSQALTNGQTISFNISSGCGLNNPLMQLASLIDFLKVSLDHLVSIIKF